jgi:hypothetical protein
MSTLNASPTTELLRKAWIFLFPVALRQKIKSILYSVRHAWLSLLGVSAPLAEQQQELNRLKMRYQILDGKLHQALWGLPVNPSDRAKLLEDVSLERFRLTDQEAALLENLLPARPHAIEALLLEMDSSKSKIEVKDEFAALSPREQLYFLILAKRKIAQDGTLQLTLPDLTNHDQLSDQYWSNPNILRSYSKSLIEECARSLFESVQSQSADGCWTLTARKPKT